LNERIFQLEPGGQYFSLEALGMFAEGLAALTGFFRGGWRSPYGDLDPRQQAGVLVVAGYCLRAVGDLAEAAVASDLARERWEILEEWSEAADAAGNLTQMLIASGRLREAMAAGAKAVQLGRSCTDPKRMKERVNLATLADAYHQAGMLGEAERCFKQSEQLQASVLPEWPLLISYRGFLYCDLLLTTGDLEGARIRATSSLEHPKSSAHPATQGLDHLSLARCQLLGAPPSLKPAEAHLAKAEELIRHSGQMDELPRVLIAVAELQLLKGDTGRARAELRQAHWFAERAGLRLRVTDCLIMRARVEARERERGRAVKTAGEARELASAMQYVRGLRLLDIVTASW